MSERIPHHADLRVGEIGMLCLGNKEGGTYGYEIHLDVYGKRKIGDGTIYRTIGKLIELDLFTPAVGSIKSSRPNLGPTRHWYATTEKGVAIVEATMADLKRWGAVPPAPE